MNTIQTKEQDSIRYVVDTLDDSTKIMLNRLVDVSFLTYPSGSIKNPFLRNPINPTNKGQNKIVFADDTASGRPCCLVDEFIIKNVYPYYSNTHSNASCGIMMKQNIETTRQIIRHTMKLQPQHKIFFSGNGCTGAFNHLVNKIDTTKHKSIHIHNTSFEHHSNFLPWKEKINDLEKNKNCSIQHRIISVYESDGLNIDINEYVRKCELELDNVIDKKSRLNRR